MIICMMGGGKNLIKLRINGLQVFISCSVGYLFPGGRQGILLVIKTSSLFNSMAFKILSKRFPFSETNDFPTLSSSALGVPSITKILVFLFP